MTREEKINQLLTRNVETAIEKEHLASALRSGKKLRVKHGIDPTGENIHIGRAVALWKLKEFQDLGHKIVLIIGDYTAEIGDPSDKLEKRPFLTKEQIKKNLKNYLPQIGKILDLKSTEVRNNSEWLSKLTFREVSRLADIFTFQQILERENFTKRQRENQPISLREGLYPLLQGYDSVAVKADLELGGVDQLFNLLAGRKIQEHYGQKPQDIMTTKMLLGVDGRKMSTSWGNVINITDKPEDIFGKVMSAKDEMMGNYFELGTTVSSETARLTTEWIKREIKGDKREFEQINKELEVNTINEKNLKEKLAFEIVKRYHGEKAAAKAQAEFSRVFSKKETPEEIPPLQLSTVNLQLVDLVVQTGIKSKSEARRLIRQGGVSINGVVQKDPNEKPPLKGGDILKIGKRAFFKIARGS